MSSSDARTDPRVIRSKQALRQALLHLMAERPFAAVSITDIVKQARYNRGTFYANYPSKEALLDDIIAELMRDLIQAFRAPYEHVTILDLNQLHANSVTLFEHIQTHAALYSTLTRSDVLPVLKERMYASLKAIIHEEFVHEDADLDPELLVIYSIHALLGLIFYWIESGYAHPAAYMQDQLLKMLQRRPSSVKLKTR